MKYFKLIFFIISLITLLLNCSCNKEESCPEGFEGQNCNIFDSNKIQFLLDNGHQPISIYNAGISLDSLYGKNYQGGLIFYLDTINGNGMVAAPNDFQDLFIWGETFSFVNIPAVSEFPQIPEDETEEGARIGDGITNTEVIILTQNEMNIGSKTAAEICYNHFEGGYDDWFLPSRGELHQIFKNLHGNGFGNFECDDFSDIYWSSSMHDSFWAWAILFEDETQSPVQKDLPKLVRAVRAF